MTHRESLAGLFAAWQAGDALRSGAHYALGATYREARREPIVGREAIVSHFTKFFRDGPRFEFRVDQTIVEEDVAAVRYRFAVIAPGETWLERPGCAFVTFEAGTIVEWREYEG